MPYVTYEQVMSIHEALVKFFDKDGDPIRPSGVKDENMLRSALFRPQTSLGSKYKYKTVDQKAAALLHAMIQNHPFHNGNKRTALVSTLVYYDSENQTIVANEQDFFIFLMNIAKGDIKGVSAKNDEDRFISQIVTWLKKHKVVYTEKIKDVKIKDFLELCTKRGANIKKATGGSYIISANGQSIRVSLSTQRLSAHAIKSYLSTLQMSERYVGLKIHEIVNGSFVETSCFQSILPVLRKLALE